MDSQARVLHAGFPPRSPVPTYEDTPEVLHKFADGAAGFTRPQLNGGPAKAIDEFMETDTRFGIDRRWEYFCRSKNTTSLRGFLRRKL